MSAGTLRNFFEQQSSTVLGADRKAKILSNIKTQTYLPQQHTTHSWSSMRGSWYFRTVTTAALAFTLIYVLYTPVSNVLFETKDGTLVARQSNVVQAGYIGEIMATQGDIIIMRNGVETSTSQLQGGDIVYLYNTSKADFTLRDGSHGVVEGPAQLTIVAHDDTGLVLSVNHARYMEIDRSQGLSTGTDNTYTNEQLTIETSASRITTDETKNIHLALVTTQDRQLIQNKGDDVTIESVHTTEIDNPATEKRILATSHVADVTNTLKVYEQIALIYEEFNNQTISQTYDLSSPEFAINDIKALLAFDTGSGEHNNNTTTKDSISQNPILAHQQPTVADTQATITNNTNEDIGTLSKDVVLEDDDSNDAVPLLALDGLVSTRSHSNFVYEKSALELSRSDEQQITTILSQPESGDNNTTQIHADIAATSTVEIKEPIQEGKLPMLSHKQLQLLHVTPKCLDSKTLQELQTAFEQPTGGSLGDLSAHITTQYYVDSSLLRIINNLYLCENTHVEN